MALSQSHWTLQTLFQLDYAIEAICDGCSDCKVLLPEYVAQFTSWETRMAEIERRLKCERCKRRTSFHWRLVTRHPLTKKEARDFRNR